MCCACGMSQLTAYYTLPAKRRVCMCVCACVSVFNGGLIRQMAHQPIVLQLGHQL